MHTSFVASRALRNYSPGYETDNPRSLQRKPAEDIGHQIPPPLLAVSQSVMVYWIFETARPLDQGTSEVKAASDTTRVCTRFGDEITFFEMELHTILVASIPSEPNTKHVITKMLDAAPSKVFGPARDCKIVIPTIGRILAATHRQWQNFGCRTPMRKSLKGPRLRGH